MDNESNGDFGNKVPEKKTAEENIRAPFLGATDKLNKEERKNAAAQDLGGAEKSAINSDNKDKQSGLAGAKEAEGKTGLYTGGGKAALAKNMVKGATKGKFSLKKSVAVFAIVIILFIAGAIASLVQLFQPFDLLAQFKDTFNSMHVSANRRTDVFFKAQMDNGRTKNPIKGSKLFGQTFKISNKQKEKLKSQGIDYEEISVDGKKVKVLKYEGGDGEIKYVTADTKAADKLKSGKGIEATDFKTAFYDSPTFRTAYQSGSQTWRGAVSGWFGSLTEKFLANNGLTRNKFDDWQKKLTELDVKNAAEMDDLIKELKGMKNGKNDSEIDDLTKKLEEMKSNGSEHDFENAKRQMEKLKTGSNDADIDNMTSKLGDLSYKIVNKNLYLFKTILRSNVNSSFGGKIKSSDEEEETDKNGNKKKTVGKSTEEDIGTSKTQDLTKTEIQTKLDKVAGKFSKAANIGCAILDTIGAISLMVTASEVVQVLNLTGDYFEVIDKTEYGSGSDSPINTLANTLNDEVENTHEVIKGEGTGNFVDGVIEGLTTETETTKKTATESEGVASMYDSTKKIDTNDPSVTSFNIMASSKRIVEGMGVSMASLEGCLVAKAGAAAVSAVLDGAKIAACVAGLLGSVVTFGATSVACGPLVASFFLNAGISVGISVALGALVSFIAPIVANILTRDLVSNLGGEDLGNALTSGANIYQGGTHRSNGGSLSTIDKYKEFAMTQQQVIAENAEYERSTLGSFNITSSNTFLGSMLRQLSSFNSADSLMSIVATGGSSVMSSIAAMLPTASAVSIADKLPDDIEEYNDTNPYLASIGAIGDAYGNPYIDTDMSTIDGDDYDVADVINKVDEYGGLEENESSDGNVVVDEDSNLAKYIKYCDERSSSFGMADQNIASDFATGNVSTGIGVVDNAANGAIGAIPVIGDIVEIVQDMNQLDNIGWISGESCVAGNNSSTMSWEEGKYYQRFVEDQTLAESMGVVEKSAVTAYLDEYYEENPLDNSYEGILARYSGLTKDTVVALLDIIEYYDYVANYDASDRYAFGGSVVEEDDVVEFDNENVLAGEYILTNRIIYADVRNRVFTV